MQPSDAAFYFARPCWRCVSFGSLDANGHGHCRREGWPLIASPATGCAFWEREPGVDDEATKKPGARPG